MSKSVISFNHISSNISEEKIKEFKELYAYYHKRAICYKWKYGRLDRLRLGLNMLSIGLTVIGGVLGGVTMNPIIIGVLTGIAVIVQGYVIQSNLNSEVEECKFASTSYDKILTQLRCHLRGSPYDEEVLLAELKVVDDIIILRCPPVDKLSKRYDAEWAP